MQFLCFLVKIVHMTVLNCGGILWYAQTYLCVYCKSSWLRIIAYSLLSVLPYWNHIYSYFKTAILVSYTLRCGYRGWEIDINGCYSLVQIAFAPICACNNDRRIWRYNANTLCSRDVADQFTILTKSPSWARCHAKRTDVTTPIENAWRRPNQHCKFNVLVARIDDHSNVCNYGVWARCHHTVLNCSAILGERFGWCLKMTFNTRYR